MNGYITKDTNNSYVVSRLKPQIIVDNVRVYSDDLYGFLNIPHEFAITVYGQFSIDYLTPTKMTLNSEQEPKTHILLKQKQDLYSICYIQDVNLKIVNLCPWFIEELFDVQGLDKDETVEVNFSGTIDL